MKNDLHKGVFFGACCDCTLGTDINSWRRATGREGCSGKTPSGSAQSGDRALFFARHAKANSNRGFTHSVHIHTASIRGPPHLDILSSSALDPVVWFQASSFSALSPAKEAKPDEKGVEKPPAWPGWLQGPRGQHWGAEPSCSRLDWRQVTNRAFTGDICHQLDQATPRINPG